MDPILATAVFLFGLAFGSFLNVCIHRLPRRIELQDRREREQAALAKLSESKAEMAGIAPRLAEMVRLEAEIDGFSVVHPRSACPKCHQPIRNYDNIPVVSWLLLGGRCRHCKTPISPRYILVELLTAVLFLACFWRFGWELATAKYCVLCFLIVGLVFIDAEWKLLPDALTLTGLAAGLAFSLVVPLNDVLAIFLPGAFTSLSVGWRVVSLGDALLGAAVGASFFYFVAILYLRVRGREGMGMGDVKLMAMVGAFLGVRLTIMTIFGASLVGSLFGLVSILVVWSRRTERRMQKCREPREIARKRAWRSARLLYQHFGLPFGVFLGPMALASLFFGRTLLDWYWSLY